MKTFVLFVISTIIGFTAIVFYFHTKPRSMSVSQTQTPLPTTAFSLKNAPKSAMRGMIATESGEIKWQSRIATEPALLTTILPIQQGEKVVTGDSGQLTLSFPEVGAINVLHDTSLEFLQTIPSDFVVSQTTGTATYTKNGTIPISVRTLHVLIRQDAGIMSIMTDDANAEVIVSVKNGSATAAYNDTENTSQVVTITAGKTMTFDDTTREAIVK